MSTFRKIVNNLISEPDETNMSYLIKYVSSHDVDPSDTAYLAMKTADSGMRISPHIQNGIDVASTGGPSSLSTLLVPIYLRILNRIVPKLAVPGRPAGGVDVLATLPGYKVHLTPGEVLRCLNECGYAHFLADDRYVPLDAKLFAYRQRIGSEQSIPLVVASILAKKLAVNITEAGLDVRVGPHCNFGNSFDDAKRNARYFCSVASILGMKVTCIITDASKPYQPWIGRGESLAALNELFTNATSYSLKNHSKQCWMMAAVATNTTHDYELLDNRRLRTIFGENLVSQGSSLGAFDERVNEIIGNHRIRLVASMTGRLVINLDILRSVLVEAQRHFIESQIEFPDPVGVRLLADNGDYVTKGTPIASVRAVNCVETNLISSLEDAIFVTADSLPDLFVERLQDEVVSNEG